MWVEIREHDRSSAFAQRHQEQGIWDYPLTGWDLSIAELLGARDRAAVWRKRPGRSLGLGRRTQATLGELARNQPRKWIFPLTVSLLLVSCWCLLLAEHSWKLEVKEPRLLSLRFRLLEHRGGREKCGDWIWEANGRHPALDQIVPSATWMLCFSSKSTLPHLNFRHSSSLCFPRTTHDEEVIASVSLTNTQGTRNSSWPHEPLTYLGERQSCQQIIAIQCTR